jgi:acyl-CoA thioester hydrolase
MMMLEGTITRGIHRLTLRVYYEDTDFSGFVYHANYLKFCERARSDFMRILGVDQNAMISDEKAMAFVIRRMVCEFLRPARFDDVLEIESKFDTVAGARFSGHQRVLRGEDVLFTADVTAVLIDGRGRPKRLPPEMIAKFPGISP